MKAIETEYKGYRFRSRLEARWAVFFDAANIPYEYELERFELENGRTYLPDFYLPKSGTWIEVKPVQPDDLTVKMCHEVGRAHSEWHNEPAMAILIGVPGSHFIRGFHKHLPPAGEYGYDFIECDICGDVWLGALWNIGDDSNPYWTHFATCYNCTCNRMWVNVPRDNRRFQEAFTAARSARFEHGETPAY
jgi:hypothetical protein